jgi:hypothetical protein
MSSPADTSKVGPRPFQPSDPAVRAFVADIKASIVEPFVQHVLTNGFKTKELMSLMRQLMEGAEKTTLNGLQRKEVVLGLIRETVGMLNDDVLPPTTRATVLELVEGDVIEGAIDLVVAATKGKLDLNAVAEHVNPGCITQACQSVSKIFRKGKSGKASV